MSVSGLDRLYQQLDTELGFILTLHRVRATSLDPFQPNEHLAVSPDFLESVLQLIKARGLDIVSMDEVAERLSGGSRHQRFCAITFDDAYVDTLVEAAPLLSAYDIPYTVYVASGLVLGTAHLWWEKLEDLIRVNTSLRVDFGDGPQEVDCATSEKKYAVWCVVMDFLTEANPELSKAQWMVDTCAAQDVPLDPSTPGAIMRWENVRTLDADPLCTIGSHTVSHYALARLPEDVMRHEIKAGGQAVRDQIGHVPKHMAYPYGYHLASANAGVCSCARPRAHHRGNDAPRNAVCRPCQLYDGSAAYFCQRPLPEHPPFRAPHERAANAAENPVQAAGCRLGFRHHPLDDDGRRHDP